MRLFGGRSPTEGRGELAVALRLGDREGRGEAFTADVEADAVVSSEVRVEAVVDTLDRGWAMVAMP